MEGHERQCLAMYVVRASRYQLHQGMYRLDQALVTLLA